jgi:hypothetical protein
MFEVTLRGTAGNSLHCPWPFELRLVYGAPQAFGKKDFTAKLA